MRPPHIELRIENARRFSRLAPWLYILAVLYLGFAGTCAFMSYLDLTRSYEWQPARLPYLAVMYLSALALAAMSTYRSLQAGRALRHLGREATSETLEAAVIMTFDALRIFFAWLVVTLAMALFYVFQPA